MDQRTLVMRAREGDHDAFASLVRAAAPRLDTAARLIVRDPSLAGDAVQDALLKAWRELRRLRDPDHFDAWVYRLVVNACIDQLRRRSSRPIEVEITPLHAPSEPDATIPQADRALVDGMLRRLDAPGRAIVVLHYYIGLPLTDVATTLNIPVGTVKSRLHRALGELRADLDDDALSPDLVRGGTVR